MTNFNPRLPNNTNWAEVGCVGIIFLCLLPFILNFLLPFIVGGLMLYIGYRMYIYAEQNGHLETFFDKLKGIEPQSEQQMLPTREVLALESVKELEDQISNQKAEIAQLEKDKKKQGKELEKAQKKLSKFENKYTGLEARYDTLEQNFKQEVNRKLMECVNTPTFIPRFIHEMYKRGFKENEKSREAIRRSEILIELQEKTNDHRAIQLLTKEEALKLDIERSNWNIEKAFFNLDKQTEALKRDKWRFEQKRVEYALQQQIDQFNWDVEKFDFQKIKTAFEQDKREALFQYEQKQKHIQRTIERYEIKQREDRLTQREIEALHNLKVEKDRLSQEREKNLHQLQVKQDTFIRDIRDAKHDLGKRETLLGYQQRDLTFQEKETALKAYNREAQQLMREQQFQLDAKKKYLELEIKKGNFEAEKQLHTINSQIKSLEQQRRDLQFTERNIQQLSKEKNQELIQKEINAKQQILFACYDQFFLKNPVTLEKAFSRVGHWVDSPYLKMYERAAEDLAFERRKNIQ